MSFTCTRGFSITINPATPTGSNDMPLDQAIYSASQNKIYGVRGQYIHKFNATTGAVESTFRFTDGSLADSSIVELGGFLYVGTWRGTLWNKNSTPTRTGEDIYKIDYALTSSTALGLNVIASFGATLNRGFTNLVTDGTYIYGWERGNIFKVDPTAVAGYAAKSSSSQYAPLYDLEYDADNGVLWVADWNSYDVKVFNNNFGISDSNHTDPSQLYQVMGLTRYPAANKIYAVDGTRTVIKCNGDEALPKGFLSTFTWANLTNILAATAKPVKIKYNSVDGLIYIPTWSGDTVEILDPTSDTITSIKSGFTSPFDVVFTPTKKFAVQNSSVGLKEIT